MFCIIIVKTMAGWIERWTLSCTANPCSNLCRILATCLFFTTFYFETVFQKYNTYSWAEIGFKFGGGLKREKLIITKLKRVSTVVQYSLIQFVPITSLETLSGISVLVLEILEDIKVLDFCFLITNLSIFQMRSNLEENYPNAFKF